MENGIVRCNSIDSLSAMNGRIIYDNKYVDLSGVPSLHASLMRSCAGDGRGAASPCLEISDITPSGQRPFSSCSLSNHSSPRSPFPLHFLRNCRGTEIEPTGTRRSTRLAREEAKVAPLWRDRAKFELVQDPLLTFALDELPVATAHRSRRGASSVVIRSFLCTGIGVGLRLKLEHGFFGGMPTPKAVLVQVHPMSLGCESRHAHKLVVTCQDDLRRTARLRWRKTTLFS